MLGTFPGFVSSGFLIILATFLSAACIRETQPVEEIKEDILRAALNKNYSETKLRVSIKILPSHTIFLVTRRYNYPERSDLE